MYCVLCPDYEYNIRSKESNLAMTTDLIRCNRCGSQFCGDHIKKCDMCSDYSDEKYCITCAEDGNIKSCTSCHSDEEGNYCTSCLNDHKKQSYRTNRKENERKMDLYKTRCKMGYCKYDFECFRCNTKCCDYCTDACNECGDLICFKCRKMCWECGNFYCIKCEIEKCGKCDKRMCRLCQQDKKITFVKCKGCHRNRKHTPGKKSLRHIKRKICSDCVKSVSCKDCTSEICSKCMFRLRYAKVGLCLKCDTFVCDHHHGKNNLVSNIKKHQCRYRFSKKKIIKGKISDENYKDDYDIFYHNKAILSKSDDYNNNGKNNTFKKYPEPEYEEEEDNFNTDNWENILE